jgi:hypothetical protein
MRRNKQIYGSRKFLWVYRIMIFLIVFVMLVGSLTNPIESSLSVEISSARSTNYEYFACNSSNETYPIVINYEYINVNTTEIIEKINKGDSVEIPFYGTTFNLSLQEVNIYDASAFWNYTNEFNQSQGILAVTHSYKGIVMGEEDSETCLNIDDNVSFLDGFVSVVNKTNPSFLRWYVIENNFPDENGNITQENKSFRTYYIDVLNPCVSSQNRTSEEDESNPPPKLRGLTQKIYCYADGDYWNYIYQRLKFIYPRWKIHRICYLLIEGDVNRINSVYRNVKAGIQFKIEGIYIQIQYPDSYLTSINAYGLLTQFTQLMNYFFAPVFEYHVAHLFTGKELFGSTIGWGWQPGHYSVSQQIPTKPWGAYRASNYDRMILECHEIGHNYDGDHDFAQILIINNRMYWTIMYTPYMGEQYMISRFSRINEDRIYRNGLIKTPK